MHQKTSRQYALAAAVMGAAGVFVAGCGNNPNDKPGNNAAPTITVLSSKAEYVSGGDVLIDIAAPPSTSSAAATLSVTLNGSEVGASFKADPSHPGHLIGLVGNLKLGANTLASSYGGLSASVTLTNYPITGPILSGPQITPYNCQTQDFILPDGGKLGPATDAQCSAPTKVQYLYQSSAGGALKPLPQAGSLPSDVATTTTSAGLQVPFVVRVETGTMNRGIYQNAVLFNPVKDAVPTPLAPPSGWNKRLIAVHGNGCSSGWYVQGAAMGVSPYTGSNLTRLGEGYAVFTNTLNHPTNSCNATVAGETTMMGKERFIETFGVPAFTVSVGSSGGAYTSEQVADNFPGLFDGIFIDATFPDALAIAMSAMDDKLLNHYYTASQSGVLSEGQMLTVSGHKSTRAWYDMAVQSGRTDPVSGRVETIPVTGSFGGPYVGGAYNAAVPAAQRWTAAGNPAGARATVFDVNRNVYGIDAKGYALRPFDNVGVQYGLAQLNAGTITPEQFLDMNEKIGGYDGDGNYIAGRSVGDAGAIKRAYQSGLQLAGGGGLAAIPVFDLSYIYDEDNFFHYQWFHFAVRERMLKANGDTRNHVMWRGGISMPDLFGQSTPGKAERAAVNTKAQADGWALFIQWVAAYKADTSAVAQRDKVIAKKPAGAVDGCFSNSATPQFLAQTQTLASSGEPGSCNAMWPSWSFARAQAGGPLAADKLKCELKPIVASDYPASFDATRLARLKAIFPNGVCDWSKPGVNQAPLQTYASFGPSSVNLVFDVSKP
ncbi:hypothetical protein HSX11_22705 [Oxalobacteraceae bacterium]|nr:hypothetical protein [Oxalobacteraceae bacterium]